MSSHNISLAKLTHCIDTPKMLEEILSLYEQALQDENQFDIPNLVPILNARIQLIASAYSSMSKYQKVVDASLEEQLVDITTAQTLQEAFHKIASDMDEDTELEKMAMVNLDKGKELISTYKKLFFQFHSQMFSKSEIDIDSLKNVLSKINDLTAKKINDKDWVIKELNYVYDEFTSAYPITHSKKWRTKLATIYERFREAYSKIKAQTDLIVKEKETNPLISTEAIDKAMKVDRQYVKLLKQFNSLTNQVYTYECQSEEVNYSITTYLTLAKKVNS